MDDMMVYSLIALKKLIDRSHVKVDNEKDIPDVLRIFCSLVQYYSDEIPLEEALKFTDSLMKNS